MDSNTLQLMQALYNDNVLIKYKDGMDRLKIGGGSSLSELGKLESLNADGTPKYNKSQKLFIIADSIGSASTWSEDTSIPFKLKLVGGYLAGETYLSEKDMFTALCESGLIQHNCVFYNETQEVVEPYIANLMKNYLAIYGVVLEAVRAQEMIEEALANNDTEVFDLEELGPSYTKRYERYNSTSSQRDAWICKYTRTLELAAQLVRIPTAKALSHKYKVTGIHHIRKLFKELFGRCFLVIKLWRNDIFRRKYPAKRLVILVIGFAHEAVQIQYFHTPSPISSSRAFSNSLSC